MPEPATDIFREYRTESACLTLRDEGKTIAIGKVLKLVPEKD